MHQSTYQHLLKQTYQKKNPNHHSNKKEKKILNLKLDWINKSQQSATSTKQ
jgi:hypothetical protein